ncbi:hypothetical protein D3C76_421720 [compost metagenome]
MLPVPEPACQQAADHTAGDAAEGVGGDIDPHRREQGAFAELFSHVGDGGGRQPGQERPLQYAQAHQQIEAGHPGNAQGEQDGAGQGPQHDPASPEPVRQAGADEQGSREPRGAARQGPSRRQGADGEHLCQQGQQGVGLIEIEKYQEGSQAEGQGGAYPFATADFDHLELSRRLLCRVVGRLI